MKLQMTIIKFIYLLVIIIHYFFVWSKYNTPSYKHFSNYLSAFFYLFFFFFFEISMYFCLFLHLHLSSRSCLTLLSSYCFLLLCNSSSHCQFCSRHQLFFVWSKTQLKKLSIIFKNLIPLLFFSFFPQMIFRIFEASLLKKSPTNPPTESN